MPPKSATEQARLPCRQFLKTAAPLRALGCLALLAVSPARGQNRDWPVYLGDNVRSHYSPLDQINRANVRRLEVAWEFCSGDDVNGDGLMDFVTGKRF